MGQDSLQLSLIIHVEASWNLLAAPRLSVSDGAGMAQQVLVLIPVPAGGETPSSKKSWDLCALGEGQHGGRQFHRGAPGCSRPRAQKGLSIPIAGGAQEPLTQWDWEGKHFWLGMERATGALTHQEVRRKKNSQAVIRGQAIAEEGTILAFHLCKPGGKRKRLRYDQRHPKCLLSPPYLQQPLQDSSLAGSPTWPAPVCPSAQALESFAFLKTKIHCCSGCTSLE